MAEHIIFEPVRGSRRAHDVRAELPGGIALWVAGSLPMGVVELARTCADTYFSFRLDAAEAHALGTELLAAAAAVDADACGQGGAA